MPDLLSTATFWHGVLRTKTAVAQPPGKPDAASLPPLLPPAVLQHPELRPVAVLAVPQGRHCVPVLSLLKQSFLIEEDSTMFRKKLGTICVPDLNKIKEWLLIL